MHEWLAFARVEFKSIQEPTYTERTVRLQNKESVSLLNNTITSITSLEVGECIQIVSQPLTSPPQSWS